MMRQKRLNRQSGKGRFAPFRVLSLVAWTGLVAYLASPAWGLARWPDNNNALPDNDPRANAVVRVGSINRNDAGTGTVIAIKPDVQGSGGWLCVLTADHVVRGAQEVWIGFGNSNVLPWQRNNPGWGAAWHYQAPLVFLGPQNPNNTVVDLAILGVRVPNLANLPPMRLPSIAVPLVPFIRDIIVAGFGIQADPDPNLPGRYAATGPYGIYRSGRNTIDALWSPNQWGGWTDNNNNVRYLFDAVVYHLDFDPPAVWLPQRGDAHIFPGDSGGPSFQAVDWNGDGDFDDPGEWRLVGVHSASQRGIINNRLVATVGDRSIDVNAGAYWRWIDRTCKLVPEPASVIALAVGLMGLAYGRRRRAA